MKSKNYLLATALIINSSICFAQKTIQVIEKINFPMDSLGKEKLLNSLDSLFLGIKQGKVNPHFITTKNGELTTSILQDLIVYENKKDSSIASLPDKQLINVYPISENKLMLKICYSQQKESALPEIQFIIDLVASKEKENTTFSIPLDYLTRNWKSKKVGHTTYHFSREIDEKRAAIFEQKHQLIASNLGAEMEDLDFYMCDNYQEILKLLGYEYSLSENGNYRNGYGVDSKTIFSIMNNEDFSHDMLHYYSGKLFSKDSRNWVTEEGLAYTWGNAYYTDAEGEMINQGQLVAAFRDYLIKNPDVGIFDLFWKNPKIFGELAEEISVRSVISGIIMAEIQHQNGLEGVKKMMTAGRQYTIKSYLKTAEEQIGINQENFDSKIKELLKIA